MAYSTSNPPKKIGGGIGGGEAVWLYVSADAHTDVDATDYFSNGKNLGMEVNDVVIVVDSSTPTCTIHMVSAVDADGNATVAAATLA